MQFCMAFLFYIRSKNNLNARATSFIRLSRNPLKFSFYLLSKLPAAYFSGVRVKELNQEQSIVTVPYRWFTKNPFRSTYFACLSMAAEMSTGLLALMNIYNRDPKVSMLVTKVEGEFFKKATGITTFICEEGKWITETIERCIVNGEAALIRVCSTGTNGKGEPIATFYITWSFKASLKK